MTGPITAIDNVSLLTTITSGGASTTPSPAERSYYNEHVGAIFGNPTSRAAFLENAWIPFRQALSNPRDFAGYQDQMSTRRMEFGAYTLQLDAHDVPTSVQNNPNDPQNELRLKRYRPNYRQAFLDQNRDSFIPITVDMLEVARIMQTSSPDSTSVSDFVSAQMVMAGNKDVVTELHTFLNSIGAAAGQPNVYHLQVPDLSADDATADQARQFAAEIRAQVKNLANFTNAYTPAKNNTNVPEGQIRLVIRVSTMQQLGTLAYATSFNPEFVFALPADQIVELPDEYFDRNPGLDDQVAFLVDAGNDNAWGTLVLADTFYGQAVDPYPIKSSENRVIHHSSILGVNPFKSFITIGIGVAQGTASVTVVPDDIALTVYGPDGTIADAGDLVRGQQYSTTASVTDSNGYPAGGWIITADGFTSDNSGVQIYGNVLVALDELSDSVTITATSILDNSVTVSQTFDITGEAAEINGSGIIIQTTPTLTFVAGSGSGGTLTYSAIPTGVTLLSSATENGTYVPIANSPVAIAHATTLWVREIAASGYVFPDGTQVRQHGPYTAA